MQQLVITHDDQGDILWASAIDVQNTESWKTDGYLIHADGRARPADPVDTLLVEADQLETTDLLAWWRHRKYYVVEEAGERSVYEDSTWVEPEIISPEPPPEEPE